jgi:hypothetical protein
MWQRRDGQSGSGSGSSSGAQQQKPSKMFSLEGFVQVRSLPNQGPKTQETWWVSLKYAINSLAPPISQP